MRNKIILTFVVLTTILMIGRCHKRSTDFQAVGNIKLDFKYVDQPSHPTLLDPWIKRDLKKINRMVSDTVLLLHFDETSGDTAYDASKYKDHAVLYYTGRTDTSATTDLKNAVMFNGENSHALIGGFHEAHHDELNANHGLEITVYIYLEDAAINEQRILDRHDELGGYTLGVVNDRVFIRIKQEGKPVQVSSTSNLAVKTWYKVLARFRDGQLSIGLNDVLEASVPVIGPISFSERQTIIGAGWSGYYMSYNFLGRIDELKISSTVEYEDFENIRLAIIDLSNYASADSFYRSQAWYDYQQDSWSFFTNRTSKPSWDEWKSLWMKYFNVASDQTLSVSGAFAEATIRGVEGLNLIAVGGIQNGALSYYGEGYAFVLRGLVANSEIELWKIE